MKLFIWNDYSWKLLQDQNEYFDRKKYAVVRKLFVQWKKAVSGKVTFSLTFSFSFIFRIIQKCFLSFNIEQSKDDIPRNAIQKYFETYGKIRSIESVNGTKYDEPNEDIRDIFKK